MLLEETGAGLRVRFAARVPTPPGAVEDGVVTQPRVLARCLHALLRDAGARPASALLSVPAGPSLVRWIDMPRLDRDAAREACRFEARKYLPYPVDQAQIEMAATETVGGDEGRMRALLVAAPQAVVSSRAEALEMAGWSVGAMEPESFALLRAQRNSQKAQSRLWRGQPLTYVQIGDESSFICVAQEGIVRFVRAITWGGARLTQALADALPCAPDEARALKEDPNALLDESGVLHWTDTGGSARQTDALQGEMDRLRREIQRLLNYYRSLFPERSYEGILDRVIFCGGTADLPGLAAYFSRALHLEAARRNPFRPVSAWASSATAGAVAGFESSYAVALGLALGQIEAAHQAADARRAQSQGFVWRRRAA
ncbi:MAG: type IV pilus assembly protein PilM [Candidatus Eremiobacteraeota bacterium]|nr:type IV pilus assembly protein PilM [Candidatus Eremiobacteraeota bacterium]